LPKRGEGNFDGRGISIFSHKLNFMHKNKVKHTVDYPRNECVEQILAEKCW